MNFIFDSEGALKAIKLLKIQLAQSTSILAGEDKTRQEIIVEETRKLLQELRELGW